VITLSGMERVPLASRVVLSAGYDATSCTLELEFASGRIYQFDGVQPGAYEWLLRSPSKGAYVARMINDRYPHREVTAAGLGEGQDLVEVLQASLQELEPRKPK
jgi:hypothetical protein